MGLKLILEKLICKLIGLKLMIEKSSRVYRYNEAPFWHSGGSTTLHSSGHNVQRHDIWTQPGGIHRKSKKGREGYVGFGLRVSVGLYEDICMVGLRSF